MSKMRRLAPLAIIASVAGTGVLAQAQKQPQKQPPQAQTQPAPTRPQQLRGAQADQPQRSPAPQRTDPAPGAPGRQASPVTPPAVPGTAGVQDPRVAGNAQVAGNVPGAFLRASQAVGLEVRDTDGQRIGIVADLLIAPASTQCDLRFALLLMDIAKLQGSLQGATAPQAGAAQATSGTQGAATTQIAPGPNPGLGIERVAVIPWELLRFENGGFVLDISGERLLQSPSVMLNDPRILQDAEWAQQIEQFFQDELQRRQLLRPDLQGREQAQPRQPQPGATAPGTQPQPPGTQTPGTRPPVTPTPNSPPRTNPRTPSPGANPGQRSPGSAAPGTGGATGSSSQGTKR